MEKHIIISISIDPPLKSPDAFNRFTNMPEILLIISFNIGEINVSHYFLDDSGKPANYMLYPRAFLHDLAHLHPCADALLCKVARPTEPEADRTSALQILGIYLLMFSCNSNKHFLRSLDI
jgi:hypothetical protein